MFGRKKKQEKPKVDLTVYEKKIESINKNIDLNKLTTEIETFLKKPDNPYDYAVYTIHEFPENKLKIFEIEYGIKSPTTKFFVVIEGDNNHLQILDRAPENYAALAQALIISLPMFLPSMVNASIFYNNLWRFIENTVKSLEN